MLVVFICSVLLFANIYRTDGWTGDKSFSEFADRDWLLLAIFLLEEILIIVVMFFFAFLLGRISKKRNVVIDAQWETDKYSGIKPGDYNYVWHDFSHTERALILKQGDNFILYVQEYDEHIGNWRSLDDGQVFNSLKDIKKALFFEFDFYCKENAESDKYGEEIYIEEVEIPISSVMDISKEGISFLELEDRISKIIFTYAHKKWCKKYCISKPDLYYVCDRTKNDGERRMIFYGNPRIIIVADTEQEELWLEMLKKMKMYGYYSFDIT